MLIAAVGKAKMIQGDWVKEGATVIDVGINRNAERKLVGGQRQSTPTPTSATVKSAASAKAVAPASPAAAAMSQHATCFHAEDRPRTIQDE